MRSPFFIAADRENETDKKPEKDIGEILKKSDDRAHRAFERRDSNPPRTSKEPQHPSPAENEKET